MIKKLLKSSAFRFIEISLEIIISILLTPYLIYNLGDSNYGLWILIFSTLGWFRFVDMGFSTAIQRNIGIAIANSDNKKVNTTFSVAIVLFSCLGLIAGSCIVLIGFTPSLLGIDEQDYSMTKIALCFLSLKVFGDFVIYAFHGVYSAHLRMDVDAKISSLNTIIRVILIIVFIKEMGILGVVFATLAADIITQCLKIYYALKIHKGLKFSLKFVEWNEIVELFAFSKHVIAMSIAKSANGRVAPIIITHLLGLKMVALYSVVWRLVVQVELLVYALVDVFHPLIIKLTAQKVNTNKIVKQVFSINFVIVVALYAPLAIFSESFIRLWIGPEYSDYAYLTIALGFALISRSISRPVTSKLLAEAKHKLLSIISLIGVSLNVGLSILLGAEYGLYGVAIATAISFFISEVVLYLILFKYYCKQAITPLLKKYVMVCSLYAFFVFCGKYYIANIPELTWWGLIFTGIITELLIIIITVYLLLHIDLKKQIIKYITLKFASLTKR
jgi:O-antigen/teichoic acid export membrane protein